MKEVEDLPVPDDETPVQRADRIRQLRAITLLDEVVVLLGKTRGMIRQVIGLALGVLIAFLVLGIAGTSAIIWLRGEQAEGNQAARIGLENGVRSACVTDLRSAETTASNIVRDFDSQVADAVLNRLAVLDGTNPETRAMIADEAEQARLAKQYVTEGLDARAKRDEARKDRVAAAALLEQPALDKRCGAPAEG